MARVRIATLDRLSAADLERLAGGYESDARYDVTVSEGREGAMFRLTRERLRTPFVKRFVQPPEELRRYRRLLRLGWSLGAYDGRRPVGLAVVEPRAWHKSVWVQELGVAASHRRRGIGRRLIAEISRRAGEAGYRVIVCETQTTNARAIDFYRAVGFRLEGVDVSYYSNEDLERGEVALFMKKRIRGKATRARPGRRRRASR